MKKLREAAQAVVQAYEDGECWNDFEAAVDVLRDALAEDRVKDTGGPAFPHPSGWRRDPEISDGMTLRDYFAAKAMAGILSSVAPSLFDEHSARIAARAYLTADAMLKARGQE